MKQSEKLKVVIVESLAPMTKRLEKLMSLIDNVEVIGVVSNTVSATDLIRDQKPEVALVDINLPDMNGINFAEIIRRDYSHTQVIVLSQDKYGDTVLQAMRTGASDFLTHDVEFEELNLAIQRAGDQALSDRKKSLAPGKAGGGRTASTFVESGPTTGKIVTVYSPKGGTGVTTLAINLAIALQDGEATVALVDGNMQFGDVGVMLNEVTQFSVMDLIPRINDLDKKLIEDVMVLHKPSGLHVLAAPSRPEFAEKVTGGHFAQILESMREIFTYVVVNTSSYISDPCLAALDAGDAVVVVLTQEIAAIKNARTFLDLWEMFDMDKDRLLLVLNRFQKARTITAERISERLKLPIPTTILEDEETVFRSTSLGIPFMLETKGAAVEKNIKSIANMVRQNLAEAEEGRERIFSLSAART